MLKQKFNTKINIRQALPALLIGAILVSVTYTSLVRADQFDEQIKALQDQNSVNKQTANQLAAQASSYQDAIDKLQIQIDALQQAIVTNQQKSDELQKQINKAQAELDHDKQVLGDSIKTMYLEGQISTIEILASSKDLSDFVNREQYRSAVQTKVKDTFDKITALKVELQQSQRELEARIKDQQSQQAQLNGAQSQQNNLLAFTQSQKNSYDQQIKSNNSQIAALRAAQAAANRKLGGTAVPGDPGHGGYPARWDTAPEDSMIDDWGMLNRECVSYTAWKVYLNFGYMPYWGGVGNANQWPGDAQRAGIPSGSVPKPHSVAISMGGYYGHAMWVEDVYDNGYIHVSQYNYDLAGHYSEMTIYGGGLIYIYFGDQ